MNTARHVIWNVPHSLFWWKWQRANLIFEVAITPIRWRTSLLTEHDYEHTVEKLQRGDLIFLEQSRRLSYWFIGGIVTHVALYIGNGKCIHVYADGVETVALEDFFAEYDSLLLARLNNASETQVNILIEFAKSKIGMPFDYGFSNHGRSAWYCSRLIKEACEHAGLTLNLSTSHQKILHPASLLKGNLRVVFQSAEAKKGHYSRIGKLIGVTG